MALLKTMLPVLISSKQAEFVKERDDIIRMMESMPLLAVDAAENWAPESMAVQHKSVRQAECCAIYVGLFGCCYSDPTALEYEAAASNAYREILIYVRDCPQREAPLTKFLEKVLEPTSGHTAVRYSHWSKVRRRFKQHLWDSVGRMAQHALRLGAPPAPMGEGDDIFYKRWVLERDALLQLGMPAEPAEARELAVYLESERSKGMGTLRGMFRW